MIQEILALQVLKVVKHIKLLRYTVQVNLNLTLACIILACFVSIDFCKSLMSSLCTILHVIEMSHQCMRITKSNLVHVSLVININKGRKTNLAQHKPYLKIRWCNTSMDNSNMTMLSMELRKWIITLHNNDYLTSYSISCRHITDTRNAATASKLNVAHVTTILKQ